MIVIYNIRDIIYAFLTFMTLETAEFVRPENTRETASCAYTGKQKVSNDHGVRPFILFCFMIRVNFGSIRN